MQAVNKDWYAPLRNLRSLGSQKEKIAHMGELAEARKKHLGQFFTPSEVAFFMWRFVADLPVRNLFDNSIGSGRLLQFADPKEHSIFGVDVHTETVNSVKEVFINAGFSAEIMDTGMENIRPRNICASLINPPFSIHLESHGLMPIEGFTRIGRFGPNTSAISDEYAVGQALEASCIVVALIPKSSADAMINREGCWGSRKVINRLCAVFDLPANSFGEEGTKVATSVAVFGEYLARKSAIRIDVEDLHQDLPDLGLAQSLGQYRGKAELGFQHLDATTPTITLPVTGDKQVKVSLDGRRIKLKYACGFTQARVENAILQRRIFSTTNHRLPKGVRYAGQGKLDLEVYLIQENPFQSFMDFVTLIKNCDAEVVLDAGVVPTLTKKEKKMRREVTPLRHTIWSRGATTTSTITATARKSHTVDPSKMISPVIKQGEVVEFKKQPSGKFAYTKNGKEYEINVDSLEALFALEGVTEGWNTVHTGLLSAFPMQAQQLQKRLARLGIEKWLSWDFQMHDCMELTMKKGAVAGWRQACGKSRLAAAMILMSEMKHGLIIVESRLVEEMLGQLLKVNIPASAINVIDSPEKLNVLKQFNIISYERARCVVDPAQSKNTTYARRLRRRIGIVVADEGERLANMESAQSQALFNISAKKRFILSGTPIANYPRDMHGVAAFTSGDGTAAQPYGFHRGFLDRSWITSMEFAVRGVEQLKNDFVVLEWVTHEFSETLREGAKREIPKIANVEKFRNWLSPIIKRRLTEEPDVEKFIKLKKPTYQVNELEWDPQHLSYYLKAADEFAEIYKRSKHEGRQNNLAILLAKLQAVQIALNAPQMGVEGLPFFSGLTSKQRAVRDYLAEKVSEGKKILMYAENPCIVDLMADELIKLGIKSVKFHGGIPIAKRIKNKDDLFVNGDVPVLLLTKGSGKAGYNLPMANEVVFYDRSWSAKTESQAMARPIRTENKFAVKGSFFHLPGSLDEYQAQMVAFKSDAASAGLDWATPEMDDTEFLHLSQILEMFVGDLAKLHGKSRGQMRKTLKEGSLATI